MERLFYAIGVFIVAAGITVGVTACTNTKDSAIKEATISQEIDYPNGQYVTADQIAEKAQQTAGYKAEARTYFDEHQKDFVFEPNLTRDKFEDKYVELREAGKTQDEAIEAIRNQYWVVTYFKNPETVYCKEEDGAGYFDNPVSEEPIGTFSYGEERSAIGVAEKYNAETELKDVMYMFMWSEDEEVGFTPNEDYEPKSVNITAVSSVSNFTTELTEQMQERLAALGEQSVNDPLSKETLDKLFPLVPKSFASEAEKQEWIVDTYKNNEEAFLQWLDYEEYIAAGGQFVYSVELDENGADMVGVQNSLKDREVPYKPGVIVNEGGAWGGAEPETIRDIGAYNGNGYYGNGKWVYKGSDGVPYVCDSKSLYDRISIISEQFRSGELKTDAEWAQYWADRNDSWDGFTPGDF